MKKWFSQNWQLPVAAIMIIISLWASSNAVFAQEVGGSHELMPMSRPAEARVLTFSFVKKGESCIEAFARLNEPVTVKECVSAAHRAGVQVAWYRPDISKGPVYIVDLRPNDKIGIYQDGEKRTVIIFHRDRQEGLSSPIR